MQNQEEEKKNYSLFYEPGRAFRLTSFTRFRDLCDTFISSGILTQTQQTNQHRFLNEYKKKKTADNQLNENQSMRSLFAMKCHK